MTRRIFAFVTVLVLSLSLMVTAQAADSGVLDSAGLMTADEQQALLQQAQTISDTYDVGIFSITVEDYTDYTIGELEDLSDALYTEIASGEDAIMLILSMAERDYLLMAYGDYAQYVFNDSGRQYLADYFLDDFGIDDWYAGFEDYVQWCGEYLEAAQSGEPYSDQNVPMDAMESGTMIVIILAGSLIVPCIYILVLNMKMKSVFKASDAGNYVRGSLQLTRRSDVFTHKTVSRQKIEKAQPSNRSGGGGVTVRSSGGGHGTRGKF